MIAPGGKPKRNGKPAEKLGELATPAHGNGKLWRGPAENHVPGPGRPPSRVKAALRKDFDDRRAILNEIVDGVAHEEVQVPLSAILKHAHCPKCEGKLEAEDPAALAIVTVTGKRSARVSERVKALDVMGKYSDLATESVDTDLIQELADAVVMFVPDPETQREIRDAWVRIVARRFADG